MKIKKTLIIGVTIFFIIMILILIIFLFLLNSDSETKQENNNVNTQQFVVTGENTKIIEKESSIKSKNDYNIFNIKGVKEEDLLSQFLEDYIYEALNYSEDAYNNLLDEEYRSKKFENIDNYKEYVNARKDELNIAKLNKFSVINRDGYDEYICVDQFENYYIFYKKENMDYTVILDTYTIDLPEFLENYNKAEDEKKVGYNIEKFVSAINDEDYKYAYSVLDESFKQKNMNTQIDFENFIKNNLYANNTIEYKEVEKQGNLFVYTIVLKNTDNQSEQKELTIIMKLEEGTDFVMSFSVN